MLEGNLRHHAHVECRYTYVAAVVIPNYAPAIILEYYVSVTLTFICDFFMKI